ncbi:hypothetical protein DI396_03800 [Litorivita pollutaquae]|uniref:DUF1330 domain-containing protein n=2 Tax=Litorivita pollutaquae TaxID=2200892 RepID=A0A2V4NVR7_9RHOB|nr:hypothetical protein DI396_03800 [Litorivita pollutaquae]
MPALMITRLQVHDRRRFRHFQTAFIAIKPANAVVLAGDGAPSVIEGEDICNHVGVLYFPETKAAEDFLESPDFQSYSVMRTACAEAQTILVDAAGIDLDAVATAAKI